MKIYNQSKTEVLNKSEIDLNLGKLVGDTLETILPEQLETKEIGHYETIKTYANGGKEVKWVIDVAGVSYRPETTETEEILIYVPFTVQELNQKQIEKLKQELATYDYIGVKIATGAATREEYAEQITYCEQLRREIRELEKGLKEGQ